MKTLVNTLGWLWKRRWGCVLIGVLLVVVGEVAMRLPWMPRRLEYGVDPELVGVLQPNQSGFIWMGNMSFPSPTITLNSDGHRGPEPAAGVPLVLAFGDSEGLGVGVEDDEVWTARLQARLRAEPGLADVQVVNACQPGHGPWQNAVFARRFLARRNPRLILVRVSMQDRYFAPIDTAQLPDLIAGAERREELRRFTRFVPFLLNKIQAQLPNIEAAFRPRFITTVAPSHPNRGTRADEGDAMWSANRRWWEQIVDDAGEVPVVFIVHDPLGAESGAILARELTELTVRRGTERPQRLGPDEFGLLGEEDPEAAYAERLTLGRDPHANARQHALIGNAVAQRLITAGVAARIATPR